MQTAAQTADDYWHAVETRDRSFDGKFFYSVSTTGIYCRPSCPARRPNRRNIAFHASSAAAEKAGYRPCKRCKPDELSLHDCHAAQMADICRQIETAEQQPSLASLARAAGLSPHHFHRVFKATVGVTPKAYAVAVRQQRVRNTLLQGTSITEAVQAAGFESSGRFYANSGAIIGMKPNDYRAGGTDVDMRFAVGECWLGSILVAASDKGITAILLGDDPEALIHDLERRFSSANLIGGDARFEAVMAKVVGLVEAPRSGIDLPLDVRGTAFQHLVWQALREIPPGSTATYSEIAATIGMPKAVRAVATACAANSVAIAIPCHRVIRTDGALSGYRWGIDRKRKLLDRERKP